MDFDLRQLEIFCKVVEHRSFTRAAAEVHLAQASVSERIAGLERDIGARLLDRLGRTVEPTAVGQLLYERAGELLEGRQRLRFELEELLGLEGGSLVLGASTIPGEYLLPGLIARYREAHPGALVRVVGGDSARVADAVAAGEVELGLVGARGGHEHLVYRAVWDDELVVAVPAGHRLAGRAEVPMGDLRGEPFVQREPGSGTRRSLARLLADHGAGEPPWTTVAELGSTTAVREAVLGGLGIAILSRRAMRRERDAGLLHELRLEGLALSRSFYRVHDGRRARSPLCQRFVEFLAAEIGSSGGPIPSP